MTQTWKLARCRCATPHQDRNDCPMYAAPHNRCWNYLHALGGPRRCLREPDYHDGPHEYPPAAVRA